MSDSRPVVAGYDVVELLGFGATGEVWLAREEATGEPVALKRARPSGDLPAARDHMRREAAVLLGIEHPHLVRLRTLVPAGEDVILVLDHAAGGSLAALLGECGPLTPGEVVTTGAPLAQALAAVHGRGVVHGDVTPGNVLFTADGRPLLSDLGVARLLGEPVADAHVTEGYADPAVMHGAPLSAASDVHGLGAVCFAALTGTAPYAGGVRRSLSQLAPATPPALVEAVEAALDRDPDRRPAAAALAVALFDATPPLPVRLPRGGEHARESSFRDPLGPVHSGAVLTHRVPRSAASDEPPVSGTGRRRRAGARQTAGRLARVPWRPVLVAVSVLALLALAASAGVIWAGAGADAAAPVSAATASAPSASALSGSDPGASAPSGSAAGPSAPSGSAPGASDPSASVPPAAPSPVDVPPGAADPAVGSAAGPQPSAGETSGPLPAEAEEGWVEVIDALYAKRSEAFATGERALLEQVYVVGSQDLNGNLAVFDELIRAGAHSPDLVLDAMSATVARRSEGAVVLNVVDELRAYRVVDGEGREVRAGPARGPQTVMVELALVEGAWRIAGTTLPPG